MSDQQVITSNSKNYGSETINPYLIIIPSDITINIDYMY